MAKRPDNFAGIDVVSPLNRLPAGKVALAQNVRPYGDGSVEMRTGLGNPVLSLGSEVNSLHRLNDTTPDGPQSGSVLIVGTASGAIFVNSTSEATGLSGNPVSIVPFRPNASVQPWAYIADNAPFPNVTVACSLSSSLNKIWYCEVLATSTA